MNTCHIMSKAQSYDVDVATSWKRTFKFHTLFRGYIGYVVVSILTFCPNLYKWLLTKFHDGRSGGGDGGGSEERALRT